MSPFRMLVQTMSAEWQFVATSFESWLSLLLCP
ncbi:hypothetical protein DFR76_10254 [Nocardia pseudobrasiliensis]|uniref:Uncharacterized protein n=1 Tax=Nocardia pseudobrasiliensis TaxID=45979 RepID=A0A370IAB8_9NOCA|nr:hypothetical protein DFR76_10254 [Nocardia pseudobrasiliensis]